MPVSGRGIFVLFICKKLEIRYIIVFLIDLNSHFALYFYCELLCVRFARVRIRTGVSQLMYTKWPRGAVTTTTCNRRLVGEHIKCESSKM